jgi:GT2 family glycosyltransferase
VASNLHLCLGAIVAGTPALSIIIVNWKSAAFVRKCLASLYSNTSGVTFEILVVDNASFDGCGEMIRREFPAVRFIQSPKNLGFAQANNLGVEHSTGRILLFLNPDTQVVGPAVVRMAACVESVPDAGVFGLKLLNSDLSVQTSCVLSFPSVLNQVLDSNYLRAMFPKSSLWGNRVLFEDSRNPIPAEGVSGACLMVRRSVFEKVGRFSCAYFMYGEDIDLCFRIRQAGWKNYYVGDATVIHHGGQSTNSHSDDYFSSILMRESILTFVRTHRGKLYALVLQSATALAALCRLSLLAVAMALPLGVRRRHAVCFAFGKWTRVFRWAIGLETWVRQST